MPLRDNLAPKQDVFPDTSANLYIRLPDRQLFRHVAAVDPGASTVSSPSLSAAAGPVSSPRNQIHKPVPLVQRGFLTEKPLNRIRPMVAGAQEAAMTPTDSKPSAFRRVSRSAFPSYQIREHRARPSNLSEAFPSLSPLLLNRTATPTARSPLIQSSTNSSYIGTNEFSRYLDLNEIGTFPCPDCPKLFSRHSNLERHRWVSKTGWLRVGFLRHSPITSFAAVECTLASVRFTARFASASSACAAT